MALAALLCRMLAGGEQQKQEAHKDNRAAMAAMLASAARMLDLLAMRRRAWEGRLVRVF
jgi:hypothetical protein